MVNNQQNNEGSNHLPEIKDIDVSLDNYDEIIIGTPVWWYRPAPAIRAFLTKYDLSGKRIIPFATNAGWIGRTFNVIKDLCPNSNVENEMNIVFQSYSDQLKTKESDIDSWIKTL